MGAFLCLLSFPGTCPKLTALDIVCIIRKHAYPMVGDFKSFQVIGWNDRCHNHSVLNQCQSLPLPSYPLK